MKKVNIYRAILIIVILIGIFGYYFFTNLLPKIQFAKSDDNSVKPETQIIKLGNGWQRYVNNKLGFSIDLPEESRTWEWQCKYDGMAEVRVEEIGNKIAIGHFCNGEFKYWDGIWEISIYQNVETLDQLQNIFKENFYDTCEIEKLIPRGNDDFDVTYKYDGKDLDESKCYINWAMGFIYNPGVKKVATWNMGMDYSFSKSAELLDSTGMTIVGYDPEMEKSFKFIK
ncbi:MAG: hypothetical protein PHC97_00145 [Patescibacteria group bacterium]|nr:hypothetical protein [Patescibacteria group bacterium]